MTASLHSTPFLDRIDRAWREFATLIETDLPFEPDVVTAEGLRFLTRYLVAGCSLTLEADPAFPQFVRFADPTCSWGINNPDGNYAFAALAGTGSYRITGDLGTALLIDLQVHAPSFTEAPDYEVVATVKRSDLSVGPDGHVEIFLGPERRDGWTNWVPTTPGSESMLLRQFFGDWETERPARLAIERLDAAYPPPPLSTTWLDERLARLERWLTTAGRYWHEMCAGTAGDFDSHLEFAPTAQTDWGGHQGQSYGFGAFRLVPGEVVVIEVDPPENDYWAVQLGNRYWESLDWDRRQSSLNVTQMAADDDGRYRLVVAADDPGVANWLDPAGNPWGTVMGRMLHPRGDVGVTVRSVPLGDLASVLPASTRRVGPEERQASLRRRAVAAQLRQGY